MDYHTLLNITDTGKALKELQIPYTIEGAYLNYPCTYCGKTARIRRYGVGKNLGTCNHCKNGTNIAKMVKEIQYPDMERKAAWPIVQKYLKKAQPFFYKKNDREWPQELELSYTPLLKEKGLTEEFCKEHFIGKAKTGSLGGYTAFKFFNDDGLKIGYFGINVKDGKFRFFRNYPEFYLYNFHAIDPTKEVLFVSDIWRCLAEMQEGKQAVSNFGFGYISVYQFDLLDRCEKLLFYGSDSELMKQFDQMKKALTQN